ncbi:MAG TPA: hypothetical protein VFU23_16835 [Gemmatimonadales bacterium]|nr:hypothetical protein [Gemmatimonadales bacterium]
MHRNLLSAALLLAAATPALAQSTGTPVFHAPYRVFDRYEIGGNVSDAGNIAVEGFYGFSGDKAAKWDFALRGGVLDPGHDGKAVLLLGVDARYRVITQTEDFPLDGALVSGVGAQLVSGGSRLLIPIGLSLGRRVTFEGSKVSLVPYAEPVIVPFFGSGDSDVLVALGLGADLRINRRFEIRLGIGIGDIENFSLGLSIAR